MTTEQIIKRIEAIKDELKRNKKLAGFDRIILHDDLKYLKSLLEEV